MIARAVLGCKKLGGKNNPFNPRDGGIRELKQGKSGLSKRLKKVDVIIQFHKRSPGYWGFL